MSSCHIPLSFDVTGAPTMFLSPDFGKRTSTGINHKNLGFNAASVESSHDANTHPTLFALRRSLPLAKRVHDGPSDPLDMGDPNLAGPLEVSQISRPQISTMPYGALNETRRRATCRYKKGS
jgi:hypothetical protein